jgi:hypothetical protein
VTRFTARQEPSERSHCWKRILQIEIDGESAYAIVDEDVTSTGI